MQSEKPKPQQGKPRTRIEPKPHSTIVINQPMVRNFSTGGGHLPGDTLAEGDAKIQTKKWQGYPPENLNVLGKSMPPIPEVAIPRFTGKAEYATRVWFPDLLYAKLLASPHPHARIKSIDTSNAERMPGVKYVLTYKNAPSTYKMPQELNFQGEMVAIVVAETEDLAEDAAEAIQVEYEVLPFASTIAQSMAQNAPSLRRGSSRGNLVLISQNDPHYDADATWVSRHGDIEKGFAQAEVIKEFTYYFAGAVSVPIQPCGSVAKWEGEKLTFWGMSQGIYPAREALAKSLGINPENIRFINKYNGCTFGAARAGSQTFYPFIAHLARATGRPVKMMLTKDQELAQIQIKPENATRFKVGAMKDGRIVALQHNVDISGGDSDGPGHSAAEIAKNQTELYTAGVPHWKSTWRTYKTNSIRIGASRSYTQQEVKWAWENMIDEMAEALNIDPLKFRLMHVSKPGTKLSPASDWDSSDLAKRYEVQDGALTYDSFASVEVLEEGAKAAGWDKRNPKAGGNPGRFKRGLGVAVSQHHAGQMGYHEFETGFEKRTGEPGVNGGGGGIYGAELEVNADGQIVMKNALPDSGSNHATALAAVVAEILGFTTRDKIRVIWGDSQLAPSSAEWFGGRTITLQGAAVFICADKLKRDLLERASNVLKIEAAKLRIKDGTITPMDNPAKRVSFAELVKAANGPIRQQGRGVASTQGRALTKGVGACFAEVEVDTWTGNWRFIRAVYCHDTGFVINPLAAEADMHGSLIESAQIATDPIPWDREFPGTRHYSVGYLSYRLPTIMDIPEQTQVFVNSLEPRWFFGIKSFSETAIGSVPGAISNAIYNACGVRIREHPITREKIMAGLRAKGTA
jgi:CO/xanthine dehydrogenase Mo-binding subunit